MLAAVTGLALAWLWGFYDAQRQDKWIRTAIIGLAAYAGLLIWVLFGSRWPARARWTMFLGTIGVVFFCRFCLRISGVTGDLIPILEWRWKRPRLVSVEHGAGGQIGAVIGLTNSYPQFLGPTRDGKLPGPHLARDWRKTPPQELWRHAVGSAWSGFAIEGGRAITQEQRGEKELIVCYDVTTGAELWTHADQARYATTIAGEGPRATPTIASQSVFTLGGTGILNCLDLASGKTVWSTNTIAGYGADIPDWGAACSPLVTKTAVIITVGGAGHALVAYDRMTGRTLWAAGSDGVHWSSPMRMGFLGKNPQIVTFNDTVAGHDEETGKVLWQYRWRGGHPHVTPPVAIGVDTFLVSSGYGTGSELVRLSVDGERWRATRVWKSIRLKSKFANIIRQGDFLYGLDDGALVCLDLRTQQLRWKGDRYGHGQMILVGDLILLEAESGDIALIEPTPDEPRELSRFKVFRGKTWNPPALAGDLLVMRNDREAVCLRLPTMVSPSK